MLSEYSCRIGACKSGLRFDEIGHAKNNISVALSDGLASFSKSLGAVEAWRILKLRFSFCKRKTRRIIPHSIRLRLSKISGRLEEIWALFRV